jgi:hypothetical protein
MARGLLASGRVVVMAAWCAAGVAHAQSLTELGLLPGDQELVPCTNSQAEPSAALGGSQFLVAWTDYRGRSINSQSVQGDGDVFGIRLDAQGNAIDAAPFVIAGGYGLQQRPLVAWNGENWLVVYLSQDPVGGYFETRLRAVRVAPDGQILDAVPLTFPPSMFTPDTVGLNVAGVNGQWLVTRCIYHNDGYGTYLAGQRISSGGALLDPSPVMLIDWVYGSTRVLVAQGEYLVAGPDWNSSSTFKARRVSASNVPQGAAFTVPSLDLGTDGTGFYVTWVRDFVDIVGSRMTSAGVLADPSGTMLFPNFGGIAPASITHDGTQWWIAFHGANLVRTMRLSGAGAPIDPLGGALWPVVLTGSSNAAYDVKLHARPGGGSMLLWHDGRGSMGGDTNVWSLRYDSGNVAQDERVVSTSTPNQRSVDLAAGPAGRFAAVFISEAANDDRVVVQRLGSSGAALDAEPLLIAQGPTIGRCGIAWNGREYAVVWDEGASGLTPVSVKMRRMNPDGSFIDAAPVEVMPGFAPDVGALGDDFLFVAARFGTSGQIINLHGRRFDGDSGTFIDASSIALAGGYVSGEARVRTGAGQWLVGAHSMWTHNSSQGDALLIRVPPVGAPAPAVNPTNVAGGSGDLDIAWSGQGSLLAWRSNSLSNANNLISGRIMQADGTLGPVFTIAEAPGRQLRPVVTWDGSSFVVAWEDQRHQVTFFDARTDVYAVRIDESGAILAPGVFGLVVAENGVASPSLESAPGGVTLVATARFQTAPPLDSYRVGISRLGAPPCPADWDGNGEVEPLDIRAFFDDYRNGQADFDGNGETEPLDIRFFFDAYRAGC